MNKTKRKDKNWAGMGVVLAALAFCMAGCGDSGGGKDISEIAVGRQTEEVSCHDPQVLLAQDGKYYMFGSHVVGVKSDTLSGWKYFANGDNLFSDIYDGDKPAFAYVGKNEEGGYSIWAENVVYNEAMGKYVMYFCTTSSYIKSNLCMAVADSPEGPYSYECTFLYSGYRRPDVSQTNINEVLGEDANINRYFKHGGYNNEEWPNCIDPAVFTDAEGRMWLTYGSWSGGIFLLELDKETGLPIYSPEGGDADPYYGIHLAGGGHHSIEGPYMEYNEESGYYYLFVSYGGLEREGGYQIRQFRSKDVEGPYVDPAGHSLGDEDDHFNYGLKMMGNYIFPSLEYAYMAPGGQSTFTSAGGGHYITYHQRFDQGTEYHEPRVHQMFLNEDGWYVAAPFAAKDGDIVPGSYSQKDLRGTFYIVNHGTDISSKVHGAKAYTFGKDGSITGEESEGSFTVKEGTSYVDIELDGKAYKGVVFEMEDEAGNPVLVISAAGESNETLWCVQYKK